MHSYGGFYGFAVLKVTSKKKIETGFLEGDISATIFNTAIIAPESMS